MVSRERDCRGRDHGRDWRVGFEGIILCFSLTLQTFRFAVPPVVALLNNKKRDFSQIFSEERTSARRENSAHGRKARPKAISHE
jgi:hypothetical protein